MGQKKKNDFTYIFLKKSMLFAEGAVIVPDEPP